MSIKQLSLSEIVILFYWMEKKELLNILTPIHIDLDPHLLQQALKLINSLTVPHLSEESTRLYMIAAAAVRAQGNRVKAVGVDEYVRTGPELELFMRHMKPHQKHLFLDFSLKIAGLWQQAPKYIRAKIVEIQRTLNIYLSYRKAFYLLSDIAHLEKEITYFLMSIFWIAYLKIKLIFIRQDAVDGQPKQQVEKRLLLSLFRYFFGVKLEKIDKDQIDKVYKQHCSQQGSLSEAQQADYCKEYQSILLKAFKIRYDGATNINWVSQISSKYRIQRLADDFYNAHSRTSQPYKDHQINQLSYLQMNRRMSPLGFARKKEESLILRSAEPTEAFRPIIISSKPIEYSDEQDSEEDEPPLSPVKMGQRNDNEDKILIDDKQKKMFKCLLLQVEQQRRQDKIRRKKFIVDNNQTRITVLKWIQDQIKKVEHLPNKTVKEFAPKPQYQSKSIATITTVLQIICQSCSDKNRRAKSIYKLFLSFLKKMKQGLSSQEYALMADNFDSFLCVTTVIFTYAYKAEEMGFKEYCQKFHISVMNGFIPLNWIGSKAQLPKQLQLFVFQLEQRILFEEIWKTNCAFELFSEPNNHTYNEMVIIKRIFKHISHRLNQICNNNQSDKDRILLYKFIEELLQKRIDLLRYNNLYVILIASIFHFYSKTISIDKIIECFCKNEQYIRNDIEFKDGLGNYIPFLEYYRKYFLEEIQSIFSTPTKQNLSASHKIALKTTVRVEPSGQTQKYSFGIDSFSSRKENQQVGENYRKGLVGKIVIGGGSPQVKDYSDDQEEDLQ